MVPMMWALATPSQASPAQFGMVEGVVTGLPSGLGIANVSVTLRSDTQPWSEVRTTDLQGNFRFTNLPAGLYSLEARSAGWLGVTVSPVLVVPGVPVSEHLEMSTSPPLSPEDQHPRT
jgi:hypothetical protein